MQNVRFTAICLAAFLTLAGCSYIAEKRSSMADEATTDEITTQTDNTEPSTADYAGLGNPSTDVHPEIPGASTGENFPGDSSDTTASVPY